jgi:aspartate/methionine/tyrosine aminotransferase
MASVAEKSLLAPPDIGERRPRFRSQRTMRFTESVIREMTRLAAQHKAVNLAQGFPDFGSPEFLRQAACDAINADINQYAITWGSKKLRNAIAAKYKKTYALDFDPEREITVCCGATEGMMATLMAVTNPGDEVVIFEPYYENYGPDTLLCGADRKFVRMHPPDWRFDKEELRRAFSPRTKAIILCSPNNPTGRVFDRAELEYIASLCQEFDALAITDEIYEHILYDGTEHIPIMTLPGMRNRTVLINSMSKTFAVTGWRIGWVLAAPDLSDSIRKIHDFLTVGSAAPLQEASAFALGMPDEYYTNLAKDYGERRDTMLKVLDETGFRSFAPRGAYYILCDISGFGYADDMAFCRHLVEDVGIAAVPGSSFFEDPQNGSQLIRFCFCKKYETLKEAQERLRKI